MRPSFQYLLLLLVLMASSTRSYAQDTTGPSYDLASAIEVPVYAAWHLPGHARPDSTRPDAPLADPWLGTDKAMHLSASFLLTLSGQYVLVNKLNASEGRALPIAAAAALSLGLAKEIADSQRPVYPLFSWRDLAADALGVALAAGLIAW